MGDSRRLLNTTEQLCFWGKKIFNPLSQVLKFSRWHIFLDGAAAINNTPIVEFLSTVHLLKAQVPLKGGGGGRPPPISLSKALGKETGLPTDWENAWPALRLLTDPCSEKTNSWSFSWQVWSDLYATAATRKGLKHILSPHNICTYSISTRPCYTGVERLCWTYDNHSCWAIRGPCRLALNSYPAAFPQGLSSFLPGLLIAVVLRLNACGTCKDDLTHRESLHKWRISFPACTGFKD